MDEFNQRIVPTKNVDSKPDGSKPASLFAGRSFGAGHGDKTFAEKSPMSALDKQMLQPNSDKGDPKSDK